MNPLSTPARQRLHAALIEYQQHPARYSMRRDRPALFFSSIRTILQIAAGKSGVHDDAALHRAACFFVRSALMYPGADHYALLGLATHSEPATVKEHYRLMMRLMHPDFASGSAWPADSATRLNLAYEVLSSAERRARYDQDRARASASGSTARRPPTQPAPLAAAVQRRPRDPRTVLKLLASVFGGAGALAVAIVVVISSTGDQANLVQRPAPEAPAATTSPAELTAAAVQPSQEAPPATSQGTAPVQGQGPPPGLPLAMVVAEDSLPRTAPAQAKTMAMAMAMAMAISVPAPRVAEPAPAQPVQVSIPAPVPAPVPVPVPAPTPPAVPTATPLTGAAATPAPAPAPAPSPVIATVQPKPGPTLSEVQPLLATLLQHLQSGSGDRLLSMLDRDARGSPGAQALSRQLEGVAGGARAVRISNVQFRAEPSDGRLLVIGQLQIHGGDAAREAPEGQWLSLRAEFVSRGGAAVITGLSGGVGN